MISYIKYLFIFFVISIFADINFTNPTTVTGSVTPNLSQDGQNGTKDQIATDASGRNIYVIWLRYNGTRDIIQIAVSHDYGISWTNPTTVTGSATPDLTGYGDDPQIATDASGRYVYAMWSGTNGTNIIIQTSVSQDYGISWTNPTTVTGSATPNLSEDGKSAYLSQVTTDASGRYVYAIWQRRNDGVNYIIQTAVSRDYGVSWTNPTIVTGSATPNLSEDGQSANDPQIATDASGKYIYVVWSRSNGTNNIIQIAVSQDYGISWTNPTTVTGSATPNLSEDVQSASSPQVTTDASGRYVYAIWRRSNGTKNIIQIAVSHDYGISWTNPTSVTGSATPNLSQDGQSADDPQIATDASGRNIYVIWLRYNGTRDIIQIAVSHDYGISWTNPTTVTGSATPNLSEDGQNAVDPQITTNASGRYVYATWRRSNGSNYIIQTVTSSNFGISWANPTTVTGSATPNLSQDGKDTFTPEITTDVTGRNIYVIWIRYNDSSKLIIQVSNGIRIPVIHFPVTIIPEHF